MREAGVVGDERHPRHGDRDHEVDAEPERGSALGRSVPEGAQVRFGQGPPAQVDEGSEHDPDAEPAEDATDEPHRAEQREGGSEDPEEDRPGRLRLEAEELVGECARGCGDDDQLERGPAEALDGVQGGRDVRAAPAERGAEQDHRRDPGIRPDQPGRPDHRVPDQAADENRQERIAERQGGDEERADDEDEQRDAEVPPERQLVEEPEGAEALRDGVDAPGGRPVVHRSDPIEGRTAMSGRYGARSGGPTSARRRALHGPRTSRSGRLPWVCRRAARTA